MKRYAIVSIVILLLACISCGGGKVVKVDLDAAKELLTKAKTLWQEAKEILGSIIEEERAPTPDEIKRLYEMKDEVEMLYNDAKSVVSIESSAKPYLDQGLVILELILELL